MNLQARIRVGGCPVDAVSIDEVVAELCNRIERRIRTHVVYVNAANAVRFRKDLELRAAMERADFLLADGMPVLWASRLTGAALPGRIAGPDLVERMIATAERRGYRLFLLGAKQNVLEAAVAKLRRRHPRLQIAGFRNGYFGPEEESAIVDQINQSRVDLLLVAMGTPRQELWADRNRVRLMVPVVQGAGGTLDIIAGYVQRAPLWMQRCGLEWFCRLCQEPLRLWSRYWRTNPVFIFLVVADIFRRSIRLARQQL